jgi:hypothetical protein
MSIKVYKEDYIYNLGKNKDGQRMYVSGEKIAQLYQDGERLGLNLQQTAKMRKIARKILSNEKDAL